MYDLWALASNALSHPGSIDWRYTAWSYVTSDHATLLSCVILIRQINTRNSLGYLEDNYTNSYVRGTYVWCVAL